MAGPLRAVVFLLALACLPAKAQQVDANFQALLNALMQGTQVALLTPLSDGTIQVTSFAAPGQRTAADAALLIERARATLANFGVAQPTGAQLAVALAGGTLDLQTGRTQVAGVLPQTAAAPTVSTQIVTTAGVPTVIAPMSPGGVNAGAAAGGSVPSGGLAGTLPPSQTPMQQQAPIVAPLPPSSTATPPNTPTPFLR